MNKVAQVATNPTKNIVVCFNEQCANDAVVSTTLNTGAGLAGAPYLVQFPRSPFRSELRSLARPPLMSSSVSPVLGATL
jgi:hypothetical protein